MLVLAVLITVVWSVLDRRRTTYRTLSAWTRIWLRYTLALCMLTYGSVKVLMVQFEPPSYGRLLQPLGQFSPMALLWTFMGVSPLYTAVTGAIEVLGGLLLFFRRTTTLGALIALGAMTQVVALNLAYDVPVKLGSLHLLLLALVLLAPDVPRLMNFFILNRPTPPANLGPGFPSRLAPWAVAVKAAAILGLLSYLTWDTSRSYQQHVANREKNPTPPEGRYRVASLKVDGKPIPSLKPGDFRWQTVSVRDGRVGVRNVDGSIQRFSAAGDLTRGELVLHPMNERQQRIVNGRAVGSMTFTLPDSGSARLVGILAGHRFEAEIQRQNPTDFPLLNRGFRWVSDAPYFR